MKLKKSRLNLFLALSSTVAFGQQANRIDYFGLKPPATAELFASGTISTNAVEHSAPAFSPDGSVVLWTMIKERGKPARMMEMRNKNGAWSKPIAPAFADSTADDFYPSFSVNGNKLYFSSRRKLPGYPDQGSIRIWQVERTAGGWGKPSPLDSAVFKPEDYYHSISSNDNIYTSYRRQGGRVFDLAVYKKEGTKYLKPEPLPYNINTTRSEDAPFIAPDESYLIFESVRSTGINGSSDLYISFRKQDGGWSRPRNMGPAINSEFAERWPRVSPDGKCLFFGSDRRQGPGIEGADIYWIDAKIIDELRKEDKKESGLSINNRGIGLPQALYQNDFVTATTLLKKWIEAYPKDGDGYYDYFSTLRRSAQYALAESEMAKYQGRLSDNNDLNAEYALIKYAVDKTVEADRIVSALPAKDMTDRFRFTTMGAALHVMKKYEAAASLYQLALNIQPRGGDFYNMACAYSLAGNKEKAFDALNKAADNGFASKSTFEHDDDLRSLKTDGRWDPLIKKLDAPFETATPYKRAHHEMVYDEVGKSALLMGGSTPMNGGQWYKFFDDVWRYNASGWSRVGRAGDERSGIRLAYDSKRNKIYSYGGFTADNQSSGMLRVFENGEWKVLTNLADMKATEGGFVYDRRRDRFIAFGGSGGRGMVNGTTWEWDGLQWNKFAGQGPEARQAFAMVYDSKRDRTVLFGGVGTTQLGDTWEFDGSRWTKVADNGPEPRLAPGYAYDSKRGRLIIFGGFTSNGIKGDTWSWDGSEWKRLSETGPAPRGLVQLIYDQSRDRIVLFGGRLGPSDGGDTWEWDGEKWSEVK